MREIDPPVEVAVREQVDAAIVLPASGAQPQVSTPIATGIGRFERAALAPLTCSVVVPRGRAHQRRGTDAVVVAVARSEPGRRGEAPLVRHA